MLKQHRTVCDGLLCIQLSVGHLPQLIDTSRLRTGHLTVSLELAQRSFLADPSDLIIHLLHADIIVCDAIRVRRGMRGHGLSRQPPLNVACAPLERRIK